MKADYVEIEGQFYSKNHPKVLRRSVAQLDYPEPERREIQTLAGSAQKQAGRTHGVVRICVTIIAIRRSRLDDDNLAGGAKALRDAIATRLGIDDGDPRLKFEYRQIFDPAAYGTFVIIKAK